MSRNRTIKGILLTVVVIVGTAKSAYSSGEQAETGRETVQPWLQLEVQSGNAGPRVIDGAINPELIPTKLAYRLVFLAVAEPANATDTERARAKAKIGATGMSAKDQEVFLGLLMKFHEGLDALKKDREELLDRTPRPGPGSVEAEKLAEMRKQEDVLLTRTVGDLLATLTPEGASRFEAFVEKAKRHIKVVTDDRMSGMQ